MAERRTRTRTLHVDYLARVEGEGSLHVVITGDRVTTAELRIFEPPRFFEALLRGRRMEETPDITSRVCGICPVAYMMSACQAVERACGVTVDGALRDLRRLLYCGEWIESHALHIHLLHAPDFLGYPSGIALAKDQPEAVRRGLRLKRAGNALMRLLGGREIHPINVRVGGFYALPRVSELRALREELCWARDAALATVRWVASFDFPAVERDWELLALVHDSEYPITDGHLASSAGKAFGVADFEQHVEERQVPWSTALQATLDGHGGYLVGPLARFALNFERLPALVRQAAADAGVDASCRNPFRSVVVRALEVLFACDEAVRLIDGYRPPPAPSVEVPRRAGVGHACTEAPRGVLYHRYQLDDDGVVQAANIVPPTAQNQGALEADLRHVVERSLSASRAELTALCERVIRNHDPCISCAAHFLTVHIAGGRP